MSDPNGRASAAVPSTTGDARRLGEPMGVSVRTAAGKVYPSAAGGCPTSVRRAPGASKGSPFALRGSCTVRRPRACGHVERRTWVTRGQGAIDAGTSCPVVSTTSTNTTRNGWEGLICPSHPFPFSQRSRAASYLAASRTASRALLTMGITSLTLAMSLFGGGSTAL